VFQTAISNSLSSYFTFLVSASDDEYVVPAAKVLTQQLSAKSIAVKDVDDHLTIGTDLEDMEQSEEEEENSQPPHLANDTVEDAAQSDKDVDARQY
jgi:hypothetical protein